MASHMRPLNLEQPWALLPRRKSQAQAYGVTYKGHEAVRLDNGAISAVIEENGRASFLDKNGEVLLQEYPAGPDHAGHQLQPYDDQGPGVFPYAWAGQQPDGPL